MPLTFSSDLYETIVVEFDSTWDVLIRGVLLNCRGDLGRMQFWSFVKVAHKVTTSSVDRFMHSVRKLDDSPHLERKNGTAEGMIE